MGMSFIRDTQEEPDNKIYFRLLRVKQIDKKEAVSLTFDAQHHYVNR